MSQLTPSEVSVLLDQAGKAASVYLVGAGGCGMSGLGHMLLDLGCRVVGSDLLCNEETRQLSARGGVIHRGHAAGQLSTANPVLVVYSSAIRSDNPELLAARQLKIPIVRRAVLLSALAGRQRAICVAGMHGKTTTAAALAFALDQLGADPSYAVGAPVPQLQPQARLSTGEKSEWCVVEADESDGTLSEFSPELSVVLNIDEEHLDFYANLDAICHEFHQFAQQTRKQVIFCADDPRLAELYAHRPNTLSYGFNVLASYRIEAKPGGALAEATGGAAFEIWHEGQKLGEFRTRLLGEQNVSNLGAVVAVLHQLGFGAEKIAEALAGFQGVTRRQEELFRDSRFRVFDDYGHHPSEIEVTLEALRRLDGRRLLVAFQPHRFTRTQHLLERFSTSFGLADRLWIAEVYAASEDQILGVGGSRLAEAVRSQGRPVEFVSDLRALASKVREAMTPGDVVLFLGAGDITEAAHSLASRLAEETMTPKEQVWAELTGSLSCESVVRKDESLARRTTLRVGGTADFYVEPASDEDLGRVLRFCSERGLPFRVLGRGSNVLIRDGGFRGGVICLNQACFSRLEVDGERIHCGAGVKLKAVAVEARRHGIGRLEFLEGIPGSVGGALRMNAGAMGSWMFEAVETVRFMDYEGGMHERKASEVNVEYRGCPLFKDHIALGAVLKGEFAREELIAERMKTFSQHRWDTQPARPSAGCMFKNPDSIPAGKLIDELGLKGTRVGGAVVSDRHGNFVVNEGGATAQDVLNLIEIIKQRAKSMRGIDLQTEVEIIGDSAGD